MSEDIPGFPSDETAKPPSRRELAAQDREYRALAAWMEHQDEGKVKKIMRLRSNAEARVLINRAIKRLEEQREDHLLLLRWMQDKFLSDMLQELFAVFKDGDYARTRDILAVLERQSKLHGLDAQRDEDKGPQVVVIDSRPPWERGEVIDHDDGGPEPPALPAST